MSIPISPHHIVRDYWRTLRHYKHDSAALSNVLLFYGLPLACACGWFIARPRLSDGFVSIVLDAIAIMTALLLNLQVLLVGVADRIADNLKPEDKNDTVVIARMNLLKETSAVVSYEVLVCVILITSLLSTNLPEPIPFLGSLGAFLLYFLIVHFILVLLRLLQCVHVSLMTQIKRMLA